MPQQPRFHRRRRRELDRDGWVNAALQYRPSEAQHFRDTVSSRSVLSPLVRSVPADRRLIQYPGNRMPGHPHPSHPCP